MLYARFIAPRQGEAHGPGVLGTFGAAEIGAGQCLGAVSLRRTSGCLPWVKGMFQAIVLSYFEMCCLLHKSKETNKFVFSCGIP